MKLPGNGLTPWMQKLKAAEQFYDDKVQELGSNLKELEAIVQRKQANVRAVEEGMSFDLDGSCLLDDHADIIFNQFCDRRSWLLKALSHKTDKKKRNDLEY